MTYFNMDERGAVERLDAYLLSIDDKKKKPFPCDWLRVLPEQLVTDDLGKRTIHEAGTNYCAELKAVCQVKGQILQIKQHAENGVPRVGIECACGHQLIANIESFLPVRRAEDTYKTNSNLMA